MSSYILSTISPRSLVATRRRASLGERLIQLLAGSREASQARRVASELMAMSDRQLLDIGIGRDEIAGIAQGGRR